MKAVVFAWFAAVAFGCAQETEKKAIVIELRTGEKFEASKVSKVEPDGITVWTDSGVKKIPVSNLAKSEMEKYRLTEEGAANHAAAVAKARADQAAKDAQAATARRASAATSKAPAFITADQVKATWIKRLPQPRTLDPDYHKIVAEYQEFIAEIKDGKRDLDAQETAATYNKALALKAGNQELAANYEAELARVSQAKSEAAELAQQMAQAKKQRSYMLKMENELRNIDSALRRIDNTIRSW